MIKRPMYIDMIKPYIDAPFIKILTGIRRSGKSTILLMLKEELKDSGISDSQIIHYNFDSIANIDIRNAKDFYNEIKGKIASDKRSYLFLDEVQEILEWEKAVNSIMQDFDVDIFVTGSNSRMMSSEISTYLTGRYVAFKIYPLSFKECLDFKGSYTEISDIYKEFSNYVKTGGFPAIHLRSYTQDEVYTIVRDIYNSTIFTDIVTRSQIRKVDQLERVVKFTFENLGKTFSAKKISDYLKNQNRDINIETIYNYLSKLESAYILERCSRYDLNGKEILKTQEKFYLADVSLKYSIFGFNNRMVSAALENIVYLELRRRGYNVYIGKDGEFEIDFVAIRQDEKIYIQVSRETSDKKTEDREYRRLLNIDDNYPKYVLLMDEFAKGNYEGIKTMHIADFLLSSEY